MAKPPSGYPGPEGYPCGKSWDRSIIVDGSIPGKNFGKQFTHTLPPVVADLATGNGKLGWDGAYETSRREQLLDRLEDVVEQLRLAAVWLTPKEVKSIEWLTAQAVAELDAARTIHIQWSVRSDGSFPLTLPDTLEAFPAAKHWQDCANPNNILAPSGPHYGFLVDGEGILGKVVCPTRTEMKRRETDRRAIADHFRDAAHFIRCAEYGIWRLTLYRKAVDAWKDTPAGGAPGGLRLPPRDRTGPGGITTPPSGPQPTGPGGLTSVPTEPPPPSVPPDLRLPDAPDGPAPQPPGGPGSATTPPRRTHAKAKKKSTSLGKVVLGGAAVVGLGYLAVKRG